MQIMKYLRLLVLFLLGLLNFSTATYTGTIIRKNSGLAEFNTCISAAKAFTYEFNSTGYYDSICGYAPAVGTFFLCTYEICGENTVIQNGVYKQMKRICKGYSSYPNSISYFQEQFANASETYIPLSSVNTSRSLYYATLPNITAYETEYSAQNSLDFNIDSATWFSVAFYGYFLLVILIACIYNGFRVIGVTKSINKSRFAKLCQRFVIFPTLIPNGKYSQSYGFKLFSILFPNRIQFLIDLFFCAFEIAFYCVDYRYTSETKLEWVEWVGFRSGTMSFGKIPLLILFSGRNNFLLWITGWSYCTFLHFHKMVSIWMFIDALIHSVAFTIHVLGYYVYETKEPYFAYGIAATVIGGVMILQSFHVFRNMYYEYFLTMHIVFGVLFIVTCWYHCHTLGWMEWMVASCCVWFFDRLIRFIRMCGFGCKTATLSVVGDHLFKLEVQRPNWWRHSSGTYAYIYFAGYIFWENHPFTVVVEDNNICAYIRVKRGVTARVWKKLMANNNVMTWKICIEGPYGGGLSPMSKKYDDNIFVAGGSGAPGILENAKISSSGKLIWISQTLEFVTAYQKLIEQINIPIDIYITRENSKNKSCSKRELLSDSESETDVCKKFSSDDDLGVSSNQITINYQKPNIEDLINQEVTTLSSSNVAIVACGPPVLMDNLRNVVATNITSWEKGVDFFDEFQTW